MMDYICLHCHMSYTCFIVSNEEILACNHGEREENININIEFRVQLGKDDF